MKKFAVLLLLLPMLQGCFSSTPNSRFYLLENPAESQIVSKRKISIAVQDIIIPQYLEKPQIILQRPNSPELEISEFNRWASDLNYMLQNLLIGNLQNALPNATIKPLAFGATTNVVVKVNLEKFGGWFNENAYIKGNWQIINTYGKVLAQKNFNLTQPAGPNFSTYVKSLSIMWNEVAIDIAQTINKL